MTRTSINGSCETTQNIGERWTKGMERQKESTNNSTSFLKMIPKFCMELCYDHPRSNLSWWKVSGPVILTGMSIYGKKHDWIAPDANFLKILLSWISFRVCSTLLAFCILELTKDGSAALMGGMGKRNRTKGISWRQKGSEYFLVFFRIFVFDDEVMLDRC